jgi:membrane-bound metal-dependent hydrolase YbcI (DUF457 family)
MAKTAAPLRTSYSVKRLDNGGEHPGDMEGTTHAATGWLAGAALAFTAPGPWPHHLVPALVQGAVVGGLALLPDADHPRATFAWTAGFASRGVAHLVSVLFGGHRQGMHSLPVTAALTGLAAWFVWLHPVRPAQWAFGAFLAVCVAAGLIATGFARQGVIPLAIGAGLAWYVVAREPSALVWMLPLGMGIHIAEDECTGYGCALLWPFTRRRFGGSLPGIRRPAAARRVMTTKGVRSRSGKAAGGRHVRGRRPAVPPRPRSSATGAPVAAPVRDPHRTGPWKPGPLWHALSADCLDGNHGRCTDRACECDHPRCGHPAQKPRTVVTPEPYDPDEIPPF